MVRQYDISTGEHIADDRETAPTAQRACDQRNVGLRLMTLQEAVTIERAVSRRFPGPVVQLRNSDI